MRVLVAAALAVTVMAMSACAPKPSEQPGPTAAAGAGPTIETPPTIGGWRTDAGAYAGIGKPVSAFRTSLHGGGEVGSEELRGRWTILAFWGLWSEDSLADLPYLAAMASAADQDPDLDILAIHTPPKAPGRDPLGGYLSLDQGLKERGGAWRTAVDETGSIAAAFGIDDLPTYLLVGPDLVVEAVQGELNEATEDGIKPMFRGIAELRRRKAGRGGE